MHVSRRRAAPYDQMVLIGRSDEQRRIEGWINDVRAGRGGALVVRGEAGVGKTAILDHAARSASDFRILRASGIQSEAELAYATLHALLHPLTAELASLPRPQADALRSALALGPSEPGDAFATFAGVLGLLVAVADRERTLVVLDDAHLVDRSWLTPSGSPSAASGTSGSASCWRFGMGAVHL